MRISVSDAKAQLAELVRRAEAGEEVILTKHGQGVVRLQAVNAAPAPKDKRRLMEALQARAAKKAAEGPQAARSQDFLYSEDGSCGGRYVSATAILPAEQPEASACMRILEREMLSRRTSAIERVGASPHLGNRALIR